MRCGRPLDHRVGIVVDLGRVHDLVRGHVRVHPHLEGDRDIRARRDQTRVLDLAAIVSRGRHRIGHVGRVGRDRVSHGHVDRRAGAVGQDDGVSQLIARLSRRFVNGLSRGAQRCCHSRDRCVGQGHDVAQVVGNGCTVGDLSAICQRCIYRHDLGESNTLARSYDTSPVDGGAGCVVWHRVGHRCGPISGAVVVQHDGVGDCAAWGDLIVAGRRGAGRVRLGARQRCDHGRGCREFLGRCDLVLRVERRIIQDRGAADQVAHCHRVGDGDLLSFGQRADPVDTVSQIVSIRQTST